MCVCLWFYCTQLVFIYSETEVGRRQQLEFLFGTVVIRKLAELGYHRNAKKCKEKFENIYKHHKRTKECRPNTKIYRFFEQLELLDDNLSSLPSPSQNKIQSSNFTETTMANMMIKPLKVTHVTIPFSVPNSSAEFLMSTSASTTSSSGKESEGSGKRKRKLGDYFERLMREVLEKQENLQNIEALEKCGKDRLDREEAWKVQELARIKREKKILTQERAISAAKDAAGIAFLQKIFKQVNPSSLPENPIPIPTQILIPPEKQENCIAENSNSSQLSSSRWPKVEVEALISVRANLDLQYKDNGSPKGPLWEDISSSMKKLGYDRSAKRCKEKWENINKYFRRVKESNEKRAEDSKTCPYFQMLESLYQSMAKKVENSDSLKPEDILMQMMGQPQPQQQQQQQQQRPEPVIEDGESENVGQNEKDYGDDDDDDDENGDNYQIVANNPSSLAE
ncbi:trihelix transcription factor DF1-like [Actinidia eriantha]|uniref:trihelix transcription factor DF1-like n=1 Tax=Actinidia eriantha TaxID=165200 RepID=UPI00258B42E5|nr:trihelix transcription factor DF1-like [Actinidia eriantha]